MNVHTLFRAGRLVTLALGSLVPAIAFAGNPVVYSPSVTQGQTEFEFRASRSRTVDAGNINDYAVAIGHAFNSWWRPEIYLGRYVRGQDGVTHFAGTEFENIFQVTPTGRYWADAGLLLSYEFNPSSIESDKLEFGPLFEKRSGRILQRLNLLWEKGVGPGSTARYAFHGGYSFRYNVRKTFAPGFEIFATPGDADYRAGPVLYGEKLFMSTGHELDYSAGVLLPMNSSSPRTTLVLRMEYELF